MGVHLSVENAINFYIIAAGIGVCGMCFLNSMRAPIRNLFRNLILAFLWMMALIQYTAVPEGRGGIVLRAVQVYSAVHILLLPLAAIVAQAFYSDIKFIMIATVVASVYMFVAFTNSLTEKYEKQ